ncbi:unnamed protein product [Dracunculus medinensis]|uniref:UBX domain-containing protein n=1 Tax=Dracunculus medinensis TaxID=318479 RepID=A0A0N4U3K3_DRAME|nr:unnamed protein product [Dracunculus medinensis]
MSESDESIDSHDLSPRMIALNIKYNNFTIKFFRINGLRKRRNFFSSFISAFKKPSDPSKLSTNANFTQFNLTSTSLQLSVDIQTERRKKRKGNANRLDTFKCYIRRFPTSINPDSAEFEIMEPASGNCFILLTLMKTDNLAVNWKEFQDSNGTIDASTL